MLLSEWFFFFFISTSKAKKSLKLLSLKYYLIKINFVFVELMYKSVCILGHAVVLNMSTAMICDSTPPPASYLWPNYSHADI